MEFQEKVAQSGKWPEQACTTMFFRIPTKVTSERPLALMPTLIRWWEGLRALEVAKWQQKYRVHWDATDGRNGGADRTLLELLMEMERLKCHIFGLGSGERLRAGQSSSGSGLGDALQLSQEDVAGALRIFRAPEAGSV